jgi:hypothetical protein
MRLRPHQEAVCCLLSIGLLLFLNRKTEKTKKNEKTNQPGSLLAALSGAIGQ